LVVQGESGVRRAGTPEFLHAARRITDLRRSEVRHGAAGRAVCVADYGVTPDAFTLAKSLAGALRPGDHGTTFGGSPVPAAAALEHLHVRDALDLETQVEVAGTLLRDEVAAIARDWPEVFAEPRGHG
jgi:acetylornithine/N-succinyldiaminopimelate aminotransferase